MTTVVVLVRSASGKVSETVLEDGPLEMGRLTRLRVPGVIVAADGVAVSVAVRIPSAPGEARTVFAVGHDLSDSSVMSAPQPGPLPTELLAQALVPLLRGSLSLAARRRGELALDDAAPAEIRCLRFSGARRCNREAATAGRIEGVFVSQAEHDGGYYLVLAGEAGLLARHRSKGVEATLPERLEPALFAAYAMHLWPGPEVLSSEAP